MDSPVQNQTDGPARLEAVTSGTVGEVEYIWLIGGEKDALVIAKIPIDSLGTRDGRLLIPYTHILDGVEYLDDPSRLRDKTLNPQIDAGSTGGIEFYTGKAMERIMISSDGRNVLKDDNNSALDFVIINHPTPEFHYTDTEGR